MSWIENMSINIFPMVLAMVVFVSNRFKFGKTISARVFDLIIVFDFFLMLVDIEVLPRLMPCLPALPGVFGL